MGGGIGMLVILVVALGAAFAGMLMVLNARWKSPAEVLDEARENIVGTSILVGLGLVGLSLVAFVLTELL